MIALCAILLLAPDSHGQTIKKRTFTISGTVGVAGVTMQGLPVAGTAITTDDNGVYTAQVDYGWSGTVKPVKGGYTFQPPERTYTKVIANATKDDYKPTVQTYTITGTTNQPNVKLIGFLEEVASDATGRYATTVIYGWAGTVLPEKTGYRFEPPSISYGPIDKDMKEQNYKAYELTFTISGTAGAAGVALTVTGLPKPVMSGPDGSYRVDVRHGWSGTIKPVKDGVRFTPEERPYQAVMENQTNQDYQAHVFTYEITGTTGLAGVIMKGLPEDPITNENGYYSATVTHGWSGKVTPEKAGQKFDPPSKPYTNVKTKFENQDYKASAIYLTISGTAGTGNVTLVGLPGDPQGDATGTYTAKVPYGFTGTVTPTKLGWSFTPPSFEYNSLAQDQLKQNFKPQRITFKITGNVGQPQVTLGGFPTSVVSGPDGSYSADVDFNWKGTVIPRKDGFTFEPASREYNELQMSQASQDYQFSIMKHSITGRVLEETGTPLADVIVAAEGEPEPVTTGPDGKFDLKVSHRWQGRVSFQKDGYTFTPTTRSFQMVVAAPPEVSVSAKVKMLTITDRIVFTGGTVEEPIAGVKVTAIPPGANPVVTDLNGKYSVKVPYGWTGVLLFEKAELVFDPNTKAFTNVTDDIDNINPKPPAPTPPEVKPPSTATATPPATATTTPGPQPVAPADTTTTTAAQATQQRMEQLNQEQSQLRAEISAFNQKGQQPPADKLQRYTEITQEIAKLLGGGQETPAPPRDISREPAKPPAPQEPIVGTSPLPDLLSVLAELARQTGVTIAVDMTVKPDPVPVSLNRFIGQPVTVALQGILSSTKTPYTFETVNERTYKVYRPLTNSFPGGDLIQALQDLSVMAGVPIIPDPNVTGTVNVSFDKVPFETALQMLLAGKPLVFKKTPHYYLVADRGIYSRAFVEISETRRIRLNNMQATRAKLLLSPAFSPYVQAEPADLRDPNDEGNTLVVTAAPEIIDRIVADIGKIDVPKRQVLLDARIVSMEKGNLLNLGTEWSWPTLQAGAFTSHGISQIGGTTTSGWPYGVQIGYGPDQTFTNSLMMALNLLEENSQADIIANPKVVAQDGRQAEIRVVQEEWFMMTTPQTSNEFYSRAELQKIESGTVLTITPRVGDNNEITLHMAVEVSDSIPKARGSDLPLVTRRTARNAVTVKDGGTVAVGGLTENRSKSSHKRVPLLSNIPLVGELFKNRNNDKASREVAVFVTAHLVSEGMQIASAPAGSAGPAEIPTGEPAASPDDFRKKLAESMRQNQ
jgi:type II secretory pathway component HofQ